jgi:hypothetical protein
LELAKILCVRGQLEAAVGNVGVARSMQVEVQGVAVTIGVGPDSELSREIAKLRSALDESPCSGSNLTADEMSGRSRP